MELEPTGHKFRVLMVASINKSIGMLIRMHYWQEEHSYWRQTVASMDTINLWEHPLAARVNCNLESHLVEMA